VQRRDELAVRLWKRSVEKTRDAGLPERCVEPLAFGLTGRVIRDTTCRRLVPDVSQNVASRDLTVLVAAGLFGPIGEKRGRRHVPAEAMRRIADEVGVSVNERFPGDGDPYEVVGS
jgi:hypothetical protein